MAMSMESLSSISDASMALSHSSFDSDIDPDKLWLTQFLDIDSILGTSESKRQMDQIKDEIMNTIIPSHRGRGFEESGMDTGFGSLRPISFESRGVGPVLDGRIDPNGPFWFEESYTPSSVSSEEPLMEYAQSGYSLTSTPEPNPNGYIMNEPGLSRSGLCGVPLDMPLTMNALVCIPVGYPPNNTWETPEPRSGPPGFPHPSLPSSLAQQAIMAMNRMPVYPVYNSILDELNSASVFKRTSSISRQRRVTGRFGNMEQRQGTTPLHIDTFDTGRTGEAEPRPHASSDLLKLSPKNLETYTRLSQLNIEDLNKMLRDGLQIEPTKLKDGKNRDGAAAGEEKLWNNVQENKLRTDCDWRSNEVDERKVDEMKGTGTWDVHRRFRERYRRHDRERAGPWCNFCQNSGLGEEYCRSHNMQDPITGKTQCPRLLSYTCPICGEVGHTKSYCIRNGGNGNNGGGTGGSGTNGTRFVNRRIC